MGHTLSTIHLSAIYMIYTCTTNHMGKSTFLLRLSSLESLTEYPTENFNNLHMGNSN